MRLACEQLASSRPRRWSHVQGVLARAQRISGAFDEDRDLLTAAAVLHDVGYSPGLAATGFHPLDGARHLRTVRAPDRLVNLVAHHSCAHLEAGLRGLSRELAEFTDERTPLRDALWYCDLTTTPDGDVTTVTDRLAEIRTRYGSEHLVSRFIKVAEPELVGAVERTEARLRMVGSG